MKPLFRKIIISALLLAIWQAAAAIVKLEILLPSPAGVMRSLGELLIQKDFYITNLFSFARVIAGFAAGVLIGILAAVLSSVSVWLKDCMEIIAAIMKAAPVASFIILAIVWFKKGNVPLFASMVIVMPLIFLNVYTGIKETPANLIEMSKAFNVNKAVMIRKLYLPSIRPYLTSAATTSMGMAWKAGIAAEIIASPKYSIGAFMNSSKVYLNTADLFAWTVVVIILSMALERLLNLFDKRKDGIYDKA